MNPNDEEPFENERLQGLVKELTEKISHLFAENDQIKKILENIEKRDTKSIWWSLPSVVSYPIKMRLKSRDSKMKRSKRFPTS